MDARLATYISLTFGFAVTPGVTTAIVVRSALEGGQRAGFQAVLGAAAGNTCQAAMAGFGLSLLLHNSPVAFQIVRACGAAYIAWLGGKSLWLAVRPPRSTTATEPRSPMGSGSFFRQALITNLLNLSVTMFYVAVVPSFLPPSPGPLAFAELGAIHVGIALGCHSAWVLAFSRMHRWFARAAVRRTLEGVMGVALLLLAWKASGI
jgi:threonine/homoserine/homoserine lactone efflux protein